MSQKRDMIVVWPAYLDSRKTRAQGRMVPKNVAVDIPTAEEIFEVSRDLNLQPILENAKKMPQHSWERPGRVLVNRKEKKVKTLKMISLSLQKKRGLAKKQTE